MMTDKEKLVEMLRVHPCYNVDCEKCDEFQDDCWLWKLADKLLANGVRLEEKQATSDKASEWIPVSERLPENDYGKHWKERKYYLVCLKNGQMLVARYGYKEYGWWIDSHDCVIERNLAMSVTHWMPLPQPPEE